MPTIHLITVGITPPVDFPASEYNAIHRITIRKPRPEPAMENYKAGWNGLAYRFLSCASQDERFRSSILKFGTSPPPPKRYIQEDSLFVFFAAGLSVLETFSFAAYAVAAMLNPTGFPLVNPRSITPEEVHQRLAKLYPQHRITKAMQGVLADSRYEDWKVVRNILAHRSSPGRVIHAGGQDEGMAEWKIKRLRINVKTTAIRRKWLSNSLAILIQTMHDFVIAEGL